MIKVAGRIDKSRQIISLPRDGGGGEGGNGLGALIYTGWVPKYNMSEKAVDPTQEESHSGGTSVSRVLH